MADALAADRAGEVVSAASLYEHEIAIGDPSLAALLNLALLYWQSTDPGISASLRLTREFLDTAARRVPELLEEARVRFPGATAARFWEAYIAWTDLGDPLDPEECRNFLRAEPSNLAPAMYLFMTSHGTEAEAEARELLRQSRAEGTTGARYVESVLASVLRSRAASG